MDTEIEIRQLSDEFKKAQKILIALGNEVRQHLIPVMMNSGD